MSLPAITNYADQATILSGNAYQTTTTGVSTPVDTFYGQNPWAGLTANERLWYDPVLRDVFRKEAVFSQHVTFMQNLAARNAPAMQMTMLMDLHPNFNPIGLRDQWIGTSHVDSKAVQITFDRYGQKVSYSAYDPIITYWREQTEQGNTQNAVRAILQGKLAQSIVDIQDLLARNAMLQVPFQLFANGKSNFAQIAPNDLITTPVLRSIHLGMKNRDVPYTQGANGTVKGDVICITSPSVMYDIYNQTDPRDWLIPMAYGDARRLLNYEVGTYQNVRFIESRRCTLYNTGKQVIQSQVTVAIHAGDGAAGPGAPSPLLTKADGSYIVGQPGTAVQYITLGNASTGDMNTFAVGDRVTVHTQRTNAYGVSGGVDYLDGTAQDRRIVAIDASGKRLQFNEPLLIDMTTDLGGGVFAYVTKGVHVNAAVFIGGSEGIVMGVGRPPRMHNPPPIDDFDHIYRFSWDSYQGYNLFRPEVLEVFFCAGSYREVGGFYPQA